MHRLVASWFGTGLILGAIRGSHLGSGTVGALLAAPIALGLHAFLGWQAQLVAALLLIALSVWSASHFVAAEGDAGWIVVDEAAGAFVALIGLGLWPGAVVAFIVFRLADIFKSAFPGVAQAERLPGSAGVTADDVIAGLYGLAVGHLAQALL